jgi:hypothetical protein
MCALVVAAPAIAAGQSAGHRVSLHGGVGTLIGEAGDDASLAVAFSPGEGLEILIGAERLHWPTEETPSSATRGGTTTVVSGEVRFSFLPPERVSPYVLVSAGLGTARLNVNSTFPDRVTNDVWLTLFGSGVRVPVTKRLSVFADVRISIQGEVDTIRLLVPVRGGLTWRF